MNILILSAGTRNKIVQYFKRAVGTEGKVIEEKRELGVIFGPTHFIKLYYGANGIEILKVVIRLEEETANPFG